jgi:hypothetical protein
MGTACNTHYVINNFLDSGTVRQYHPFVNNKRRKTLTLIFQKSTPAGLEWRDVASLIKTLLERTGDKS